MSDVKLAEPRPLASPLFLRDEELRQGVDLLFFAFRDVMNEGGELLAAEGLGRAHRRALHFIARHPGLSVAELLDLLKITKQSLARVLKHLLTRGLVEQRMSRSDRRKRELRLTERGEALDAALWAAQRGRIARAFREAGPDAVSGFRRVLTGLSAKRPESR